MGLPTILYIQSTDHLRCEAARWDDLWFRSEETQPTARAALVAQWVDHFRSSNEFQAVVICNDDRFLAALPLVPKRKAGVLKTADIPGNEWSSGGQLLLDAKCDTAFVCDQLLEGLAGLHPNIFWFGSIPVESATWAALCKAADCRGFLRNIHTHCQSAYIRTDGNWNSLQASWSKGFRRHLRRAQRRLSQSGTLRLRCEQPSDPSELQHLLLAGLQMEHASWKGAGGTSVLADPDITFFVQQQAARLSQQNQLQLAFLDFNGRPIAFEYGWLAKGAYHSHKVAYAVEYAKSSPGQLLTYFLLERFFSLPNHHRFDFVGPITRAIAQWQPTPYVKARLMLANPGWTGNAVLFAAQNVLPHLHAINSGS